MNLNVGQRVTVTLGAWPGTDRVPFQAVIVGFNLEGEPIVQRLDKRAIRFRNSARHVLDVPRACIDKSESVVDIARRAISRENIAGADIGSPDEDIVVLALTLKEYEAIEAVVMSV